MTGKSPLELFFLWFFSQSWIQTILFVPILALAFVIGIVTFVRGRD